MQQYETITPSSDFGGGQIVPGAYSPFGVYAQLSPVMLILTLIIMVWVLVWKSLAMWKASRKNRKVWFVLLLALNTVGILEIIYYFFVDNDKKEMPCSCKKSDCICVSEVKAEINKEAEKLEKAAEKWWHKALKKLKK